MATLDPISVALRDGTDMEIRAAHPDDALAGLDFSEELHASDARHLLTQPDEFERDLDKYAERIGKTYDDPRSLHVYAWCGGAVIADALFIGNSKRRIRHTGWIGLGVLPAWQRRGVGRVLMTTLLDWTAAHEEIERVTLKVFTDHNRAIPLYETLGFVRDSLGQRAFKLDDGSYGDEFAMCLYVKPGIAPDGFNTYPVTDPTAQ